MALKFILGDVGSGKTRFLYEKALELSKDRNKNIYYIVPEQFTMQTQYDLVMASPAGGILNIDVTSLARLSHKAFEAVPGAKKSFLPEIGKSMIIKRVLADKKAELLLFARNTRQAGFVAKAKAMISELYQYSVGIEELEELIHQTEDSDPVLYKKLKDGMVVLRGFEEKLSDKYLTNEGIYDAFAAISEKSQVFKNSYVILDGFTGFTPSQVEILRQMLRQCIDVYVSFTIPEAEAKRPQKEYDIFYTSEKSIENLRKLADEVKAEVDDYIFVGDNSKEYKRHRWITSRDTQVNIYSAKEIQEEAQYVSMEIERLVRTEGYQYKDIAVVATDLEAYGQALEKELEKVKALYFLDRKKALYENECAAFILGLLGVMENDRDVNRLIDYAKNSLSGVSYEDACLLENYCLAMGIKGYAFKKPFVKESYGRVKIELSRVEAARNRIYEDLKDIIKVKRGTVKELSESLLCSIEKAGLKEKLESRAEEFAKSGDRLREKEYRAVFPAVLEIIAELNEFLGDEEMTVKEFRETMEAGLSEAKVRLVPLTSDYLVIGDLERTRLKNIKALFVMGVNDGQIYKSSGNNGLFTDRDRTRVSEMGFELSPGKFNKLGRDKFYIYMALNKSTERLYLSYCGKKTDGTEMKPASLINDIKRERPELKVMYFENLPRVSRILTNDYGHSAHIEYLRELEEKKIEEAVFEKEKLRPETADMLYGEKLVGSISRLESFAACPFKHFMSYGLKVKERDEFSLESNDYGTTAHAALELFGREVRERGLRWFELSAETRAELVRSCTEKAMSEYKGGIFESDETRKYTAERIKEALTLTVDMMCYKLSGTDFEPRSFEMSIRDRLYVTGAEFTGSVDRIDVCEKDSLKALKIVDYKSSAHEFDLLKLYYGLSLQLPTYMLAALNSFKDYKPGAMLYDVINEPFVDDLGDDEANLQALRKTFKTKGLVSENAEVIKALDYAFKTEAGNGVALDVKSDKIPVNTVKEIKNGKLFDRYSQTASEEEFSEILKYTNDKLQYMVNRIKSGDVSRTPYMLGNNRGCNYCDYRSVCGFDTTQGCRTRKFTEYSKEEIKDKILWHLNSQQHNEE